MLTLVIKGTPAQARAAAAKRGITLGPFIQYNDEARQMIFHAESEHLPAARRWFHEPTPAKAPYPTGTLLFYSLGE